MRYVRNAKGKYHDITTADKAFESRVMVLRGNVSAEEGACDFPDLLYLNSESKVDPIRIYICSFGGSVHGGLGYVDMMNYIQAPVYTYCLGYCMSMGAVILSQGAPGNRYAFENSTIMIHEVSSVTGGTTTDLDISTKEVKRLNKLLAALIAKSCGKSINTVEKDIKRDLFMGAKDALKYGIVDAII